MTSIRRGARDTFRSLHVRNFRLFFAGQLISQVGNWLTLVAQTLLVLKLTDSGVALGALAAAQFGPVLVLGPWGGLIADRSDKRRLLLIVQTIAMAQSFVLAALAFSGHPPVLAIYGVALIGGVTIAFDNPARRSFVVEMVPEEDMNNAVSLNSALMTSARVVGPALAGLLIATVGFGWCFLADGLSYLAVLTGLWMIRTEELRSAPITLKAKGQVRAGLRYARSVTELWVPLVMMAVVGTLSYNFQTVFPLFTTRPARHRHHVHDPVLGRQRRCADRRAGNGPAHEHQRAHGGVDGARLRHLHGTHGGGPEPGRCLRLRRAPRHHQHRLPHRVDGHRADRSRPGDARPRARPASDALPRQHPDRRPDRRVGVPTIRRPLCHRTRRGRRARRRHMGSHEDTGCGGTAAHPCRGRRVGGHRSAGELGASVVAKGKRTT